MSNEAAFQFDGTGSDDESTEPTTFFTRRHLMKGTAGAIGVAALAGLGLWYGTQPSLAASTFEENGEGVVPVTTNAGEVTDVTVAPVFALDWANFGGGVSGFDFDLVADVGGATHTVYSETGVVDASASAISLFDADDMSNYDGTATVTCAPLSIIDGTDITTSDFPTNVAQGASQSQDVTLRLTSSGTTNIGGTSVDAAEATISFTVEVTNPDGTVTAEITSSNAEASAADDEGTTTV